MTLAQSVAFNVKDAKTTTGLMETLSSMYEKPSKSRGHGKPNGGTHVVCWGCGDEGHLKKDCPKRVNGKGKKKVQESNDEEDASNNLISEYDSDVLMVSMDDPKELIGCSGSWVWDSGFSHHSSPCKELFRNFKSEKLGKVYLADDKVVQVMGQGNVSLKLTHGGSLGLKDVKYIPRLKKSLISVTQLATSGHKVVFDDGSWKLVKGAMVITRRTRSGTLYTIRSTRKGSGIKVGTSC